MNEKPIRMIRDYWQILIALIFLIVGWVNFQNADLNAQIRITDNRNSIVKIEVQQAADNVTQQEIKIQLIQIQTDISWIRKTLIK